MVRTCHLLHSELLEPWGASAKDVCGAMGRGTDGEEHAPYEDGDVERGRHGW